MKQSNKLSNEYHVLLKNEIEETFGKKISSSRDCILLSEEIFLKNSFKVNSNTLRRFFGLVQSNHSPSSTTLDILSKYCGFTSHKQFTSSKSNNNAKACEENNHSFSVLNYLISLFTHTPARDHDKTFLAVVKQTIQFLQRHPEWIDKFQRAVSKTRSGQEFYYEQFINIDALNSYYGKGLRYYLNEKKTLEAQLLGNSLLCLKNWLINDPLGVKENYNEVIKYELPKNIHPALCARYFATKLLYANMFGLPAESIQVEAHHAHASSKKRKENYKLFPYFEYVISPTLLLVGQPQEALYYINYSLTNYPNKLDDIETGFYLTMDVIKALALVKTGKQKEAGNLYRHIHPSKFDFLTKKINTIMYLVLSQYFNKNNVKSDQQLEDLIKETGFTKLDEILGF